MKNRFNTIIMALILMATMTHAADNSIRLNSLGFIPWQSKKASINVPCSKFSIVNASDNTVVYADSVGAPKSYQSTGEKIYIADFSKFADVGVYYLKVDSVGRTQDFPINYNIYDSAYCTAMRAMYLMRCGTEVQGTDGKNTFHHDACHIKDANMFYIDKTQTTKDSQKGWHDAGDYNKYVINAGITVGMLFTAWNLFQPSIEPISLLIPESDGKIPDFLAEIKWEIDWLFTMQLDDGKVCNKVSTTGFGGFILPELESATRYFAPWGSAPTADFVAMMAMASRMYKPYDSSYAEKCLVAAKKSYDFLAANLSDVSSDLTAFTTGTYGTKDSDDRLWAAAEMWEATGEQKYLTDFETRANTEKPKIDFDFDWSAVKNLGMFTYLLSSRDGRKSMLVDSIKTSLINSANSIYSNTLYNPYGRTLSTSFYWGANGSIARQTMILQIANKLAPNANYLNASLDALGYLLGRNYYNRSFVTGIGINPPLNPHDRRSGGDTIKEPWPGYLVGGGFPGDTSWQDKQASYETNEIAINWQGALVFALAGFVDAPKNGVHENSKNTQINLQGKKSIAFKVMHSTSTFMAKAGTVQIYDSRGRLLKTLAGNTKRVIDLRAQGLGQEIVIVKMAR